MSYIAQLQINVDSSQVESANRKLQEFIDTSKEASKLPQPKAPRPPTPPKVPDPVKEAEKQQAQLDAIAQKRMTAANNRVAQLQAVNAQADASEQARLNNWLKEGEKRTKEELKQAAAVATAREQYVVASQGRLAQAAQNTANADKTAQKAVLKEQQAIDKIRYKSTLSRWNDEAKAAKQATADRLAEQLAEETRYHNKLKELEARSKVQAKEEVGPKFLRGSTSTDTSGIDKQTKAMHNLLGSIDPVTRSLNRLDQQEKQLKATYNNGKGSLPYGEYVKYQAIIDEARKKTAQYNDTLQRTGITAKQVRLAQQNLPAQFTDIIVSLQGGQAPLTVLLQQGGQIKDMFGGIGNALKGVAGAIMPMINPMTLAAAAMATMALAWYDGSNQLSKLNKALIQNGNAIGMSAGLLRQYASANGDSLGSIRENIDALGQLVANGNLVPSTYDKVAEAATSMANVSGEALDKIIADFTSLGKEPVASAEKLNEKYNFLTASVHAQAQALVSQGKEQEAIKLLTDQLADVVETRAKRMEDAATGVAKKWREVKNAISDAWTSVGEGLNPTAESKLAQVNAQIDDYARGRDKSDYENTIGYQYLLNKRKELVEQLYEMRTADETDTQNKIKNAAAVSAQADSLKKERDGWSALKKAKEELREYDLKLAKSGDVLSPDKKGSLRQPYLDAIKKAEEAEAKKLESGTPKSAILDDRDVNELANKVTEIKAQYAALAEGIKAQQDAGTLSAELGFAKRQQLLTEEAAKTKEAYQGQIDALEALKGSKNISANQTISLDRKIEDARSKMVVAEQNAQKSLNKSAAEESLRLKQQTHNVDAYNDSLQQMIDNLRTAGARDRAGLSMSSGQRDVYNQMNSEDDRYASEVKALNNQAAENPNLAAEVEQKLKAAAKAHTDMKDQIVRNYQDMKVAQQDWGAGVKSAFEQYVEDGQNYAGMTNQAFSSAFSTMEDAIVDFAMTGKLSFADLTKSILSDMARIATRAAASQALSAIFGAGMSMFGGTPSSAGSTAAGYDNLAGWKLQAKGGAWSNGTQFFAKGGAFTNSVVSKPTAFAHAGGLGVMGEAGKEAIMPLTRSSDGSLGVRAQVDLSGLQQQTGGGVIVNVNIDGQGNTTTESSDAGYSTFGKDIGQFVDQRYRTLLGNDLQPGGAIWKSMQG